MQGIWSRCFPLYAELRRLIDADVIGKVQHVQVSFGEYSDVLPPRVREKDQAGGAVMDRGGDYIEWRAGCICTTQIYRVKTKDFGQFWSHIVLTSVWVLKNSHNN